MSKKDPYRFSVAFNGDDPEHVKAAEILNSHGRKTAQFLVQAILSYSSARDGECPVASLNVSGIREVVIQCLDELGVEHGHCATAAPHHDRLAPAPVVSKNPTFDEQAKSSISNALAMFRGVG